MKEKYNKVPDNLITGKDLDYLNDMFGWNYINLKMVNNCITKMSDKDVISFFEDLNDFFEENLKMILNVLKERGDNNE